jgi:hypothetical protein
MNEKPKPKLTRKNVKSFLSAYSNILIDKVIGLPSHTQEQIIYRHELCKNDCFVEDENGKKGCVYCGCDPYDKAFAKKSCNDGERFPDLMDKKEWDLYYKKNI